MAKKDWMVKVNDLDDDQKHVFLQMLDKSCIVSGCAGSGKSVLALIMAQRIQKERGNDYQIIVFTRSLSRYMSSGRDELQLNNDFYYHWQWKNRLGMPSSEYVIVDEIQDFSKEEIGEFIDATKKHFYFFGDTSQSIYDGMVVEGKIKHTLPVENILTEYPKQAPTTKCDKLFRNYRLPLPVAKAAQPVGLNLPHFDPSIYQSTEKDMPYLLHIGSMKEQVETIIKIIKDRDFKDVGIFLPDNPSVENISSQFEQNNMDVEKKYYNEDRKLIDTLNFNTTLPKVMTYHSAKGLQFEAVFIPMLPSVIQYRSALYVAMTRTTHYLYMMHIGVIPGILSPTDFLLTTDTGTKVDDK